MATTKSELQQRRWTRDEFFISLDPSLFPIPRLMEVFDSKEVYWTMAHPPEIMRAMLENSLSFGLYEQQPDEEDDKSAVDGSSPEPKLVGIARCVTDYITFAYLTDVWVDPGYQGKGLGTWLIQCVQEVLDSMPYLRRSMLLTGSWEKSVPFYRKLMHMVSLEPREGQGLAVMVAKGRGHPTSGQR